MLTFSKEQSFCVTFKPFPEQMWSEIHFWCKSRLRVDFTERNKERAVYQFVAEKDYVAM